MNDKCAVVILNWNKLEDTVDCIISVLNSDYPNFEIIVTDNGYDSSFPQILRKLFPQIVIVENKKNLGFAEGNNVGIRTALERGADYVFILNNDTLISKMAIRNLVKTFKGDSQIGVVGAMTWEYIIPNQHQNCGGYFNAATGELEWFSAVTDNSKIRKNSVSVDFVFGSAMCVSKKMVNEIGLFDSDYFLYFEDIEWCYRAKINGWRVVIGLDVFIWHKMGTFESGKQVRPLSHYYYIRNYNIFIKTYGGSIAKLHRILDNIKLLTSRQLLLLKTYLCNADEKTASHYAIRQAVIDFYLRRKGEQNTWKLNNRNGPSVKSDGRQTTQPLQNDRKFRIFIPLPDLTNSHLESTAEWLIPLAHKFPEVEFILWIYPCNMVNENQVIEQNQNYDVFSEGWLLPELWPQDLLVRWIGQKASIHLTGVQISKIVLDVRPKVPRLEALLTMIFPRFPIRGIRSTIFVNNHKVKDIQLRNRDFQKVEIDFPPTDNVHLSVQSDKSCRYGISNYRRISLAISRIEYFQQNGHNGLTSKILSLSPASITSAAAEKMVEKIKEVQNIKLISSEALRNMGTLYPTLDSVLLCSSENSKLQWGILLTCCRNGIPVIATKEALGNLPLVDKKDLLIADKEGMANAVQSLIQSNELKTNLSDNLKKSMEQYLGLSKR